MIKVLIIVDKPNWAYDSIAKSLLKYNKNKNLNFTIDYIKKPKFNLERSNDKFDLFFFMGWQSIIKKNFFGNYQLRFKNISKTKIICGIHSHHSWDNRLSTPDHLHYPDERLIKILNSLKSVNLVSKRLYNIFIKSGLENGCLTYNGVDTDIFQFKKKKLNENILVGYSGSKKHDWRKGISKYIIPSSEMEGVKLHIAAPEINYISYNNMYKFYHNIDIYICASSSEGFSLSVLEALACGKPVISSKVGGCEEIISNGINGFLVEREVKSFKEKIKYFTKNKKEINRMGASARKLILENWSWSKRSKDWYDFILNSLNA